MVNNIKNMPKQNQDTEQSYSIESQLQQENCVPCEYLFLRKRKAERIINIKIPKCSVCLSFYLFCCEEGIKVLRKTL
jgi:hypothetical protein